MFVQRSMYESGSYLITTLTGQNRWKVNTYIVTDKSSGMSFLIDPGEGSSELVSFINDSGFAIEFVLLTHGHFDHLASASAICSEFEIPCVVHPSDHRLVRQAPFYAVRYEGSKISPPRNLMSPDSPASPLGAFEITTVATPGHTPGGCCYITDCYVFTGDTLIREAVGRTDQPGSNSGNLSVSIDQLLAQAPDNGIILPGHGRPWVVTEARKWWEGLVDSPPQLDTFL